LKVNIKFIQVFYKFLVILVRDITSEEQISAFFTIFHYNRWKEAEFKKKIVEEHRGHSHENKNIVIT